MAVVTATYGRADGSSPASFARAAACVAAQTYTDFTWYVVGDAYEPREEFDALIAAVPSHVRVVASNRDAPGERGRYTGTALWACAGMAAYNEAHAKAIAAGAQWIAHLDDDDTWDADHLQCLVAGITHAPHAVLVHTQSMYSSRIRFPQLAAATMTCDTQCMAEQVIHSSVAVHVGALPPALQMYERAGDTPADKLYWQRLHGANIGPVLHIPIQTVYHLTERVPGGRTIKPRVRCWAGPARSCPAGWHDVAVNPAVLDTCVSVCIVTPMVTQATLEDILHRVPADCAVAICSDVPCYDAGDAAHTRFEFEVCVAAAAAAAEAAHTAQFDSKAHALAAITLKHSLAQLLATNGPMSKSLVQTIAATVPTFHHHTHSLAEVRALLGPGPKTYTEIGTYCGATACLMAMHGFPTSIHCVDPMHVAPTSPATFHANVAKFNGLFARPVTLHQQFSTDAALLAELKRAAFSTDILFIDGDHSAAGVVADFRNFLPFVARGGWIVFDDYLDVAHSPEVKPAVDGIVAGLNPAEYDIVGVLPNVCGAFSNSTPPLTHLNEFFVRRR